MACMSRDFDIFMSKHLAGQWLLNSYYKSILTKESRQEGGNVGVWRLGYFWEQYFCFGWEPGIGKRFMPTMRMTAKSTQPPQL